MDIITSTTRATSHDEEPDRKPSRVVVIFKQTTRYRLFAQLRFISDVKRVFGRVLWWGFVGNEAGRKEGRQAQAR